MLPEPHSTRRPPHGLTTREPDPDALHELRSEVENLLMSTLTLLRRLRDGGLLAGALRHQAMLVAVDGGRLELALDTAHPDATAVEDRAERQTQRRRVLRETIAEAGSVDDAVAALLPADAHASNEPVSGTVEGT